jgi:hypothetical protein
MVRTSWLDRRWPGAALAAISAVGLLTAPTAQAVPYCKQFSFTSGLLNISQSDRWTVKVPAKGSELYGQATAVAPGTGVGQTGYVQGGIGGPGVEFTIQWDNGHHSRYFAQIQEGDGTVTASGREDLRVLPSRDTTTWTIPRGSIKCLEHGDISLPLQGPIAGQ